jgi:Beta propeller domain
MPKKSRLLIGIAAMLIPLAASAVQYPSQKTLRPFKNEAELTALFDKWAEERKRREGERRNRVAAQSSMGAAASPSAPASLAKAAEASADSVTNVQHAGVDEGGIVKLHGDYLVILRRGRLFTVQAENLKPVSMVDAYGPGIDPRGAWYDEMLISGSTVAVIGYSYQRGGTEIGLFEIGTDGGLAYKSTHHLRSNDYYSSRNYASRLVGSKLVFYSPMYLNPWNENVYSQFPAARKWEGSVGSSEFKRIAPATRIYRSDEAIDPWQGVALHTVTTCDISKRDFSCESTSVMGPHGRVFYVSPESVYVWNVRSAVFRIPLDGSAPSSLKVAGSPVDQFSFLEENGNLNVLVRANGRGEAMWSSEARSGDLSLLRVHLSRFSDGTEASPPASYHVLPSVAGGIQNRYVGQHLLYGGRSQLYAVRYSDGASFGLPLPHNVERIEAIGGDAVAIGSDGKDLHFSSIRLAPYPVAAGRYTRAGVRQGETRSHGFFYSERDGLLGLPIIGARRSASLLYLRNASLGFSEIGTLDARPQGGLQDGCRASCVDWYGNSRPLFIQRRVFALMGYEIVEGRLAADQIVEARRVNFAPGAFGR